MEGKLADYELIELLLGFSIPRCDVKPIARDLIKTFGGIRQIFIAPFEDLIKVKGVKENTATLIKLTQELMILDHRIFMKDEPVFHDSNRLANYCKDMLSGKAVEELHVLYLDSDYKLIVDDLHSVGTTNWAAAYPREILKRALNLNAISIVMMHNHPISGTSFSTDDVNITNETRRVLASSNIDVYDHFLVSGGIVHSMKNMSLFK
jgi:DNA repair protein RadC